MVVVVVVLAAAVAMAGLTAAYRRVGKTHGIRPVVASGDWCRLKLWKINPVSDNQI